MNETMVFEESVDFKIGDVTLETYFGVTIPDYGIKISMASDKMLSVKEIDDKTIFPFDIFVMIISKEFEEMRTGKIERRTITDRYISMYGQNAL